MIRAIALSFGAVCLLAACEPQGNQTPRMSHAQAEPHCTQQASRYANTPLLIANDNGIVQIGLQAETPDKFMVQDFYKRCFFANTGQRPTTIPDLPYFS